LTTRSKRKNKPRPFAEERKGSGTGKGNVNFTNKFNCGKMKKQIPQVVRKKRGSG